MYQIATNQDTAQNPIDTNSGVLIPNMNAVNWIFYIHVGDKYSRIGIGRILSNILVGYIWYMTLHTEAI